MAPRDVSCRLLSLCVGSSRFLRATGRTFPGVAVLAADALWEDGDGCEFTVGLFISPSPRRRPHVKGNLSGTPSTAAPYWLVATHDGSWTGPQSGGGGGGGMLVELWGVRGGALWLWAWLQRCSRPPDCSQLNLFPEILLSAESAETEMWISKHQEVIQEHSAGRLQHAVVDR